MLLRVPGILKPGGILRQVVQAWVASSMRCRARFNTQEGFPMFQLVAFDFGEGPVVGLRNGDNYYNSATFASMREILDSWDVALEKLSTASQRMAERKPLTNVKLLAPLAEPRNIYFAGANYHDHVKEMSRVLGMKLSDQSAQGLEPWFLVKSASSVVGPGAQVRRPKGVEKLDWEIELAVVIGKTGRDISEQDALDYVAGYTIANDLSARDKMARGYEDMSSPFRWDWLKHKSFDGACPLGPAITPAVHVADVQNLALKLWVNDVLMQDSNTSEMICGVRGLISKLSHDITLHPGDVILTGTPAGVGTATGQFLQPGDRVRQSIESIGEFEFTIV
jgi:2-keto-4-pentenoate hydratase/2-oxohepta-3-ene-1,7-dioic acid hydratase in catechol pathway